MEQKSVHPVIFVLVAALGFAGGYATHAYSVPADGAPGATPAAPATENGQETDTDQRQGRMDMNDPDPVEVAGMDAVPQVEIVSTTKGSMGEYNIEIATDHFTFTPEHIDADPVENTGHAHVYVNDEKVGRVYGNWIYLPGKHFTSGENKVTVTLNANTHGAWTFSGAPIEATTYVTY